MKKKKETEIKSKFIIFLPLILFIIVLIAGISFALIRITLEGQRVHVIEGEYLTFSYTEQSNNMSLSLENPLTDNNGRIRDDYFEFSVSVTDNRAEIIPYEIYLQQIIEACNIPKTAVKVYLTSVVSDVETEVVAPVLISNLTSVSDRDILYTSSFTFDGLSNTETAHTYRLRVWVDANADLSSAVEQFTNSDGEKIYAYDSCTFEFKVNVKTIAE